MPLAGSIAQRADDMTQHTVILQTLSCQMNTQRKEQFQRVSAVSECCANRVAQTALCWKVPGLPAFSLCLNVGRRVAVSFPKVPHLFPYSQGSCLAGNSHVSGAGFSWEGTYHPLSAEQGMNTNWCLGWCTHQTVGHPNVVQSLCSSGAHLFLSLDRQPRVRAVSWNLQGHVCCAQASSAAPGFLEQQEALAHSPFSAHKNSTWGNNFPLRDCSFHSHRLVWTFYPAFFHHSNAWGCSFSAGCRRGQQVTGYRVPGAQLATCRCPLPTPAVGDEGQKAALLEPSSICPSHQLALAGAVGPTHPELSPG